MDITEDKEEIKTAIYVFLVLNALTGTLVFWAWVIKQVF